MTETKNIIKKLIVEVDSNSMEEALHLKDNINGILEAHIYPKLNDIFNSEIGKNEYIQFNSLNIDISNSDISDWITTSELLIKKIESQLREKKRTNLLPKLKENNLSVEVKNTSKAFESFIHFLDHGQLPWWNRIPKNQFEKEVISSLKQKDFDNLYEFLINKSICLDRFIYQFDNHIITKFYLKFLGKSKSVFQSHFDIPTLLKSHSYKKSFWQFAFTHIKAKNRVYKKTLNLFEKSIANTLFKNSQSKSVFIGISKKKKSQLLELLSFLNSDLYIPITLNPTPALSNRYVFHFSDKPIINNQIEKILEEKNFQLGLKNHDHVFQKGTSNKLTKNNLENSNDTNEQVYNHKPSLNNENTPINSFESKLTKEIEEDGIIIQQAGLVLLHPFLKAFFEKLEFTKDGKLIPSKRETAIHILHYLATGKEKAWEHEMMFEKFMCDLPLFQPVNRFITITEHQKVQCEELLKAVLGHWKSIKTENIHVLQNEFFQREGKLSFQNDKVLLTIPRKTQDILLDSLPWNIHMVKIPWKEKLLFVNW